VLTKIAVVLSTLQNVQEFMTTNASALGSLNTSGSRRALDALEGDLSSHAASQTRSGSGRKAAIARQRVLKSALLVKYLRPISAIAEAQLAQSPDFIEMKLPSRIKATPQLLATAAAMAGAASPYAATFIDAGMSTDFIAELEAAAEALKAGATIKGSVSASQLGATGALKATTKQARKVVRQLDALIQPRLASNIALLTKWKATKRFVGRAQPIASATVMSAGTTSVTAVTGVTAVP
jgi:uncharacterized protein with FMN-binding domain